MENKGDEIGKIFYVSPKMSYKPRTESEKLHFVTVDSTDDLLKALEEIFAKEKGQNKKICANIDLYSGLIYQMLRIPEDLYTPLFAIARVAGWSAHRIEELIAGNRVIRPAYKSVAVPTAYIPLEKRENNVGASSVYVPLDER